MLPPCAARNLRSFLGFYFISALAERVEGGSSRQNGSAKWEPAAQSSATKSCLSVELTFCSAFALRWAWAVLSNSHPARRAPRGSRDLLSQLFTRLAEVVPSNWQPGKLAAPPLAVTSGSLEIYGRGRWAQVDSSETLRQAQLLCPLKLCLDKKEGSSASSIHFETAQKCERNLQPQEGLEHAGKTPGLLWRKGAKGGRKRGKQGEKQKEDTEQSWRMLN